MYQFFNYSKNFYWLVRSEEKAKNSKKLRNKVQTVLGQLDYLELIKEQVRATEILNNTANTDHVSSAEVFRNAVAAKKEPTIIYLRNFSVGRALGC